MFSSRVGITPPKPPLEALVGVAGGRTPILSLLPNELKRLDMPSVPPPAIPIARLDRIYSGLCIINVTSCFLVRHFNGWLLVSSVSEKLYESGLSRTK